MGVWEDPKTDWDTNDGIAEADLNRMEKNSEALFEGVYRKVQGFNMYTDNSHASYDGLIYIDPGSCFVADGVIKTSSQFIKNLTSWQVGSGVDKGGVAPAVTVAAYTWYYIFAIMNPTTGDVDFMFDSDPAGANISGGVFTKKRYVGCFKTMEVGTHSSFKALEMYSIGDNVIINPYDLLDVPGYVQAPFRSGYFYRVGDGYSNVYKLAKLGYGPDYALPARQVTATLGIQSDSAAYGIISDNGFTTPISLIDGANNVKGAEVYQHQQDSNLDASIVVSASRQIKIAMYSDPLDIDGGLHIMVRGFRDERLI